LLDAFFKYKTYIVYFYISFVALASSTVQGVCFLMISMHFLKKLKKKSKVLITPYSFYLSIIINITLWAPITHYLKQIYFCPKSPSFLMTAWAAASKIDQSPFLHIMEHFLKL